MVKKITTLEPWQADDAARLQALWDNRELKISQMKFGADYNLGTQGMVWQYLTGARPLNIDAAVKFSRGLNVTIDQFSPRIAEQIADAYQRTGRRNDDQVSGNVASKTASTADEMQLLAVHRLGDDMDRLALNELVASISESIGNARKLKHG